MSRGVGYAAMGTGLVPLLALAALWARGRSRDAAWWWIAAAFGVSFVADVAGMAGYGRFVSQSYPLLQAGLVAFVLLPRPWAIATVGGLTAVSGASLAVRHGEGLDIVLHLAAWGGISLLAWTVLRDGMLRWTLAAGFLALAVAWTVFVAWPTFGAWGAVQGVRLAMAVGFVRAAWRAA